MILFYIENFDEIRFDSQKTML